MAAIKHTHHDVNERRAGDTGKFLDAGAMPVILAGDRAAVVFREESLEHISFDDPEELLAHTDGAATVLVEGFKDFGKWPRIDATRVRDIDAAVTLLDRID